MLSVRSDHALLWGFVLVGNLRQKYKRSTDLSPYSLCKRPVALCVEKVTGTPYHAKSGAVQADDREELGRAARVGGGPGPSPWQRRGGGGTATAATRRSPDPCPLIT